MPFISGGGVSAGLDPTVFLARTGGTMIGPLFLRAGDPTADREAVPLGYLEEKLQDLEDSIEIKLVMPAEFEVTGSPAGFDGTFTVAWEETKANWVFAGPADPTDPDAPPEFRHLVAADISDLEDVVPINTKGDLLTYTTVPVRFAVGTNNQVLTADSTTASGLVWRVPHPLTTKGDLFTYGTAPARLPVGTNNQVLTADSAETLGVKWAAATPLTTKGDLLVYSTAPVRLPVGTNNQALIANSTPAEGVSWGNVWNNPLVANVSTGGFTVTSGATTSPLLFATGTAAAPTERMRINATNGAVGINRTAIHANAMLDVNGNVMVNNVIYTPASTDLVFGCGSTAARMTISVNPTGDRGNVFIGRTPLLPFSSGNGWQPTVVVDGTLTIMRNTPSTNNQIPGLQWANSSLTAEEKRIAYICGRTTNAGIDSGCLEFRTYNAGSTTTGGQMRFDHQGWLGIGFDAFPTERLDVNGSVRLASGATVYTSAGVLNFGAASNTSRMSISSAGLLDVTGNARINDTLYSPGATGLKFGVGSATERMRVRTDGSWTVVGINNTADPADYPWSGAVARLMIGPTAQGTGNYSDLSIGHGRQNGNIAYITFTNYWATAGSKRSAWISCWATANATDHQLRFTTYQGSTSRTGLTIDATGYTGIGSGNTSPTHWLHVATDSAAKPGTNTWATPSDPRLKRNVRPFEGGIEIVRQLHPEVAEYNGLAHTPDGLRVVSLNPEEIRTIVPDCVTTARCKLQTELSNYADEGPEPPAPLFEEPYTDVLHVNPHEIFYHMLLAIQQLDQRLATLEKK